MRTFLVLALSAAACGASQANIEPQDSSGKSDSLSNDQTGRSCFDALDCSSVDGFDCFDGQCQRVACEIDSDCVGYGSTVCSADSTCVRPTESTTVGVPTHRSGTVCFTATFWCWANPPGLAGNVCYCPAPRGLVPGRLG